MYQTVTYKSLGQLIASTTIVFLLTFFMSFSQANAETTEYCSQMGARMGGCKCVCLDTNRDKGKMTPSGCGVYCGPHNFK